MNRGVRVVIVGGGASGTLTSVQLLRHAGREPVEIVLVERASTVGRGVAYSTTCPTHLLNVPAGSMSGLPDGDGDLVRWLRGRDPSWQASSFVPRQLYGDYLIDLLEQARCHKPPSTTFRRLRAEVVAVEDADRPVVRLADGTSLVADQVILAVGNHQPTALPGGPGLTRYIGDPWGTDRLRSIDATDHVAIAGTGLTAIDAMLTLSESGHKGKITAISRRGFLPHAHEPPASDEPYDLAMLLDPATLADAELSTARGLLRWVRSEVASAADRGRGWRTVVDALRPLTPSLWQRLPVDEQRRFRRHAARMWDVHRHRMAPEVAEIVTRLERDGRLEVVRGRVVAVEADSIEAQPDRLRLVVNGPVNRAIAADWVANCTGPPESLERTEDLLLRQLQSAGLLSPHPSGVGAAAAPDGGLLRADGRRVGWLWAVGPLMKGSRWESTAIPEIRDQTAGVARLVMYRLCASASPSRSAQAARDSG